jgi:hypothetical protein
MVRSASSQLLLIATIGSAGLSGAALAQSMPSYQIAQDIPACRSREMMEHFIKIEGTGNRAAKLRADLLRTPLIRGECHIRPADMEVHIDEGSQASGTLVCVRPVAQTECIWTAPNALGDERGDDSGAASRNWSGGRERDPRR